MSRHETPLTEGFWKSSAHGLFIAEYTLVQRGADRAPRYVRRNQLRFGPALSFSERFPPVQRRAALVDWDT